MSLIPDFSLPRRAAGWFRASVLVLVAGTLAACGGSGGTVDPPGDLPSFLMALSGSTLTITQGENGQLTVTITRQNGFTGSVNVAVEGLPQGVTASALTIASGSTSGVLQLTAAAGAATGNTALTVRGTGTGVDPKTANLSLTVNESTPNPTPDFSLALNPTSGSAAQGATAQTTVTITRTGGFAGAVNLSASGLPAGVTAGFNPAAPAGATSTVTFTVGGAVAVGTYPITIQGTGTGVPNRSVAYNLQVTSSGGGGGSGNTTFEFCGSSGLPVWVAVQNGGGAWNQVNGTNGVYTFQIDGVGGIAWVTATNGGFEMRVQYFTQQELNTEGTERCIEPGAGKTVNGTVPGLGLTDFAVLTLGGALGTPPPSGITANTTFTGVPNGPVDLVGGRNMLDFGTGNLTPVRYYIERGLNPANGSNLVIDFAGANGFDPVSNPLTINGTVGPQIATTTSLRTAGGTLGNLNVALGGGTWHGVPAGRLQAGDLHVFSVSTSSGVAVGPSQTAVRFFMNPGPLTVNLGNPLSVPTVTQPTATGYVRGRSEFAAQPEYNRYWLADFRQGANPSPAYRGVTVEMTAGYRGSATGTVALEVPNFTGVAGWNANWGLQPGSVVTWTTTGAGWTGPGISQPVWQAGNTFDTASQMGQFTP